MSAGHPHKIFASPIGAATPNAIYTQPSAKPACQEHITAKFEHLLLAELPRTQFTHSKPPNPHASKTSAQKFSHLLLVQLPRKQFTHRKARNPNVSKTSAQNFRISYWHSYPERNLHTARRQTRMPARHPRKIFAPPIGTAAPNAIYTQQGAKPACRKTLMQHFRTSYWHSYPERNLRSIPGTHQRKIFPAPIGTATTNTIYT